MISHKHDPSKIRLKTKEKLSLFSDLSTMLGAGIPILDAVESLQKDAEGTMKQALTHIGQSLYNGELLSQALAQMPQSFDYININLIRAAEAGGTLEATLHDIVISEKKEIDFSTQLRNTMIYPVFVMVVFMGVVVLMLTFVIPRISEVFTSLNVKIPLVTRLMIKASQFLIAHWALVVGILFVLTVLVIFLVRRYKKVLLRFVMELPVVSTLGTNIDFARFMRSFGLLMRAGVPIIEALDLSERVVQKKSIITIVEHMKRDVSAGRPMAASMSHPGTIVPPIMSRSLKTAEATGTLIQTLQNLNEHFDEQVADTLKVLSSLMEPVLIVVVAVMVGALMISIIAPIYSMISQINGSSATSTTTLK